MQSLSDIFNHILYTRENYKLNLGNLLSFILVLILFVLAIRLVYKSLLPKFFKIYNVSIQSRIKIRRNAFIILVLSFFVASIWSLHLDNTFYTSDYITIKLSGILQGLWVIKLAQVLDVLISRIVISNYTQREIRDTASGVLDGEKYGANTVQWLVYAIVAFFLVNSFQIDQPLIETKGFGLRISSILTVIIIMLIARLLAWFITQIILFRYYKRRKIDKGSQYAANQLLSYIIYVIAFFLALNLIEVKMNLVLGGAAALLVGVGLGLQQTFNDFFSGIILLFERSIDIGDVIDINGLIGTVRKIGIRTSIIETRDNITVIVPNSKLVVDNVINWTHTENIARFEIKLQVSFESDTDLVKQILIEVVNRHPLVEATPEPFVRFIEFSSYSLEFHVLFWSKDLLNIADIKSDLRFELNKELKKNKIIIPFPQQTITLLYPPQNA